MASTCVSVLLWIFFILGVFGQVAKAEVYRTKLHHVDAGLSISEKLARGVIRSNERWQTLMARIKGPYKSNLYPLYFGATGANYMMDVHVGSPPKKYVVVMDTGSELVWIQCSPCKECAGPMLDPSHSTSFSSISCHSHECASLTRSSCPHDPKKYSRHHDSCVYDYWYEDESGNIGEYVRDSITLVSSRRTSSSNITIGCAHSVIGDFGDGLFGFNLKHGSLLSQLPSLDRKFSYCIPHYFKDVEGHLFLGATFPSSSHSTPILDNLDGLYHVHLESVTVGNTVISRCNTSVDLNSAGTVFDSGTPLAMFNYPVFLAIKDAFIDALPQLALVDNGVNNVCFDISNMPNVKVPSFSLQFQGASWHLPQENYVSFDGDSQMCLLIRPSYAYGVGIIGSIMQQNHLISHDAKTMTISFTKTDCSKL